MIRTKLSSSIAAAVMASIVIGGPGCASNDETNQTEQASSTGATCANPTAPGYGAILNDGGDDTLALRKAICAAVCPQQPAGCGPCSDPTLPGFGSHAVCIPGGELDLTRPNPGPASLNLSGIVGLAIYGEGPGSVIAMHGPGSVPCSNGCHGTGCVFADWDLFKIDGASAHIEIRDLAMISSGVDGFDKDSIRFILFGDQVSNTDDLLIKNTRMIDSCGDDLYILGGDSATGSTTTAVRVVDSTLRRARRRAIVVKHGTGRIVFANNTFETDGGAIDMDPSGIDTAATEVIIANNSFRTTSATSIVLAGESAVNHPPATNVVVANNLMLGPAIAGGGLRNIEIRNNTILNTLAQGEIDLVGIADHIDITHNTIVRGSTVSAVVVRVAGKELVAPAARISGNAIVQPSQAQAIEITDVTHPSITDNIVAMTWPTTSSPAAAGIKVGTDHFDLSSCRISGNTVTGSALSQGVLVNLTSSVCAIIVNPQHCGAVGDPPCPTGTFCDLGSQSCRCNTFTPMHIAGLQIDRNLVVGAAKGVRFNLGTNSLGDPKAFVSDFPMIADNDFSVSATPAVDLSGMACGRTGCLPPAYLIGGNRGGPIQLVGDNDPNSNAIGAPTGSLYMQRSGTGSAALYVRENNTWVAQ